MSFTYKLVVTGPIVAGTLTLPGGNLAYYYVSDIQSSIVNPQQITYLMISGSTTIVTTGCAVNNQNITIPLADIRSSALGGKPIGTTFNPKPFNIDLTCNPSVKVSYRVDGASSVYSQSDGVLNNSTGTDMAAGVGIQFLAGTGDNPPPLPLSAKTLVTTTNSNNQPVSIPLVAQYYKTAVAFNPGQVQVQAIFTMFYE